MAGILDAAMNEWHKYYNKKQNKPKTLYVCYYYE